MHTNWYIYCLIFACVINNSFGEKQVLVKRIQCALKSKVIASVDCSKDNDTSLSFYMKTIHDIVRLYGLSSLYIYITGRKNVVQLKGLRTEFCQSLTERKRPNLLGLINAGLRKAHTNFPQKCPFHSNTRYILEHLQFDSKYLPNYIPEYNFTYIGKFFMNNVLTAEVKVTGGVCNVGNDCR
ncbi:uncharacterized protein LOC108652709 [Drosophila navojoa]|nr:uncharacterized protein LOC108652709 [Drosophila navojoa]